MRLLLALLPATFAAAYAVVSVSLGQMSRARRVALRDALEGADRAALDRYLAAPAALEARWMLLRVAGVGATSALVGIGLSGVTEHAWLLGLSGAVSVYAIPSEFGRRLAMVHPERVAPTLLRLVRPLEWLAIPVADPLAWLASKFIERRNSEPPDASFTDLTETEVEVMVTQAEQIGALDPEQSEMLRNVLDFGDVTAEELMVPRMQVHAIDVALGIDDVLSYVTETQHSRYPVYEDTSENIVGVLHVKDLFRALAERGVFSSASNKPAVTLAELIRKPVAFVPETQLATTVLHDMRAGRHHMAIVLDEFGGVSGIITLEDLLEEIVGDIQDEHDGDDEARITRLGDGRALVDASLPVTDVNRYLGTELPEGDYVSLGGLLVDLLGEVPPEGSEHEALGLTFKVREADARRVALVELGGLPPEPSEPAESGHTRAGTGEDAA